MAHGPERARIQARQAPVGVLGERIDRRLPRSASLAAHQRCSVALCPAVLGWKLSWRSLNVRLKMIHGPWSWLPWPANAVSRRRRIAAPALQCRRQAMAAFRFVARYWPGDHRTLDRSGPAGGSKSVGVARHHNLGVGRGGVHALDHCDQRRHTVAWAVLLRPLRCSLRHCRRYGAGGNPQRWPRSRLARFRSRRLLPPAVMVNSSVFLSTLAELESSTTSWVVVPPACRVWGRTSRF